MNQRTSRHITLAGLLSATLALAALPANAQETSLSEATINVSGEGQAALVPDIAVLDLGVLREAENVADALSASNKAMADVLETLGKDGIADKDLQTSGFSIEPKYRQDVRKDGSYETPVITGYQVTNTLSVKVRNLATLGGVIDKTVKLGVNQGGNIRFTNDNPDEAIEQARRNAVAEAIAKARVLADAAGVKLGRVISINESFNRPMPMPMAAMRMAAQKDAAEAVPVAAGENSYSVTVNIAYAITQ